MKTFVTYFSQTGNTKKVAEAIFSVLEDEKEIKDMVGFYCRKSTRKKSGTFYNPCSTCI